MKSKLKIIIPIVSACVIAGIFFINYLSQRTVYNKNYETGNTTGNLYNEGLFCEYDGYIYFANPYDNNYLYKMKSDGSKATKLTEDNVSYINVCGKYIYYKRHNYNSTVNKVLGGNLYGVYRINKNGSNIKCLHRGIVGMVTLCGNYIYYQNYSDTTYIFDKVKIDGKNHENIAKIDILPGCVNGEYIYYSLNDTNHNLVRLDTKDDSQNTFLEGNIYLPDIYNGYVYYIDLDNNRALTARNMSTGEITVISGNDRVINYNMCGEKNVIFYQTENGKSDHRLMKTDLKGEFSQTVIEGDCSNISVTSEYTFFYKLFGDEKTLYRTSTTGVPSPEIYVIR